jgi:MazG family protein
MEQPPSPDTGLLFRDFVQLIARLRAPGGCPWDREQTHETVKPMTIEEAYEVAEAIDEGDDAGLAGELGDLLLQVVFHAEMARERGAFDIDAVVKGVRDKMVRRHPHVFGEETAGSAGEVLRNWEAHKKAERVAAGKDEASASLLDGVSRGLPAVMEAFQMTTKAGRVGFDWPDAASILPKLDEEVGELRAALAASPAEPDQVRDEIGDVLFVVVNLARRLGVDPESALKGSNRKFRRRFKHVEDGLKARGRTPAESNLSEMDALWDEAKAGERG